MGKPKVEAPLLDAIFKAYWDISGVVAVAQSYNELVRYLYAKGYFFHEDDVRREVEFYDDPENGPTAIGSLNLFALWLNRQRVDFFRLDRSIAVPTRGTVDGKTPALVVGIFGDPDAGLVSMETVVITGHRFGVWNVWIKGRKVWPP